MPTIIRHDGKACVARKFRQVQTLRNYLWGKEDEYGVEYVQTIQDDYDLLYQQTLGVLKDGEAIVIFDGAEWIHTIERIGEVLTFNAKVKEKS